MKPILFESLYEDITFKSKTDMPLYDQMLKNPEYYKNNKGMDFEIIKMPPQKYIDICIDGFWNRGEHIQKEFKKKENLIPLLTKDRERDIEEEDYWKQEDVEFYMPVVEFGPGNDFHQEGLHRALVSKKKGLKTIPVMVVYTKIDKDEIKKAYGI